ncbi:MAG: 3'-5' exonuclease [Eubacteriales bacterium]
MKEIRSPFYYADSESDEAQFVANKIIEGYNRGEKFSDFSILYRINAMSNRIEDAFKRNGIPYRIIGGTRFFDDGQKSKICSLISM